jgi:dolichol-phosphate mannosyltransferase
MKLSVVIPAHNEAESLPQTVRGIHAALKDAIIEHEIVIVNDHSVDMTESVSQDLAAEIPSVRPVTNTGDRGFGNAVVYGIDQITGDAVAIMMADASDSPADLVRFFQTMQEKGTDCVFGSRFIKGGKVTNYPRFKLFINRVANTLIQFLFVSRYNDFTNAFKLYSRSTIEGLRPFLSHHFNLTIELPLKVLARGYTYTIVPNSWTGRTAGVSKLKLKEAGSRYFFILVYCLAEELFSRGDYRKRDR